MALPEAEEPFEVPSELLPRPPPERRSNLAFGRFAFRLAPPVSDNRIAPAHEIEWVNTRTKSLGCFNQGGSIGYHAELPVTHRLHRAQAPPFIDRRENRKQASLIQRRQGLIRRMMHEVDEAVSKDAHVSQLFQEVTNTPARHTDQNQSRNTAAISTIQIAPYLNKDAVVLPRLYRTDIEDESVFGHRYIIVAA